MMLFFGIIFAISTSNTQEATSTDTIIDATKNTVTQEVKQSTRELLEILDDTVTDGKIPIFKALKNKRKSKKKIKVTASNLEKIIQNTIDVIEKKIGHAHPNARQETNTFVLNTKKQVFDMHKKMMSQMKKSVGRKTELVIANTNKTKEEIAKFQEDIVLKIVAFSNQLKATLKR